jgi:HK97 family phage major capsid protein
MTLADIMKRTSEINARMADIAKEANMAETTVERMAELDNETTALVEERNDLTRQSVQLRATAQAYAPVISNDNIANVDVGLTPAQKARKKYASREYREAFMNKWLYNIDSPLLRADASTTTTDAASVIIPTTITAYLWKTNPYAGSIFARVTKTNHPFGLSIPKASFSAKISWPGENKTAEKSKATTGSLSFTGYKAQIQIAISLEAHVESLEGFESAFGEQLVQAFSEGYDEVIVAGDGAGKPTGILTTDYTKAKTVLAKSADIEDYAFWLKAYAQIPRKEQAKATLHINKVDWQAHILGMKDNNGKVIALETIGFGGELVYTFCGKPVCLLEDQGLGNFDGITGAAKASKATAFAYFFDDSKYVFNSNMQLTLRQYIDESTDEIVRKATSICDGKVVDDDSLLIVCRNTEA